MTCITPADAGCYVDGSLGQYAGAHMVERATELGWRDEHSSDLAHRHMAAMGPSTAPTLTDAEFDELADATESAESWLNEHVAPAGYAFGWDDGGFYLWSIVDWQNL